MALKPIKVRPTRELVASSLRTAIITKHFAEGRVLTLEETAHELGVSVTPVREAFQILARDGLIEYQQNHTAVVRGLTEAIIHEHYQVRAALESFACETCCETKADIAQVHDTLVAAEHDLAQEDARQYAQQNYQFHYAIWDAAGNQKMTSMLVELWNGLSVGANMTQLEYAHKSCEEHKQIYEALERRDAEAARSSMVNHILRSECDIMTKYV